MIMYTCPQCGSHNVVVYKTIRVIEYWTGDDCDTEEDLAGEREFDDSEIECSECGAVGAPAYDWH